AVQSENLRMLLCFVFSRRRRHSGSVSAFLLNRSSDFIDPTVDIFSFFVPPRPVYGEQWIKFLKDCVNATPLPTVNTTGYIDHAAFLGTRNPDTNKIPKHLLQCYVNINNNNVEDTNVHDCYSYITHNLNHIDVTL